MDRLESKGSVGCCGAIFYASCEPGRPESFRLECCTCGRLWREDPDGSLVPADDPATQPHGDDTT